MKIKTPKQYCEEYLAAVYDDKLDKQQEIEVSCAFYAGVEATCKFIEDYLANDGETDEDVLVRRLVGFRKRNKDCAMHVNLLRFGE